MGLSTERKVFLGLVGVAGLALVLDQGFLGPKEASASPELDPLVVATDQGVDDLSVETAGKPAAAILIDRLKSISSGSDKKSFSDSFSMSDLIMKASPQETPMPIAAELADVFGEEVAPAIAPSADDLPALSAVMPAKTGGGAVLGGKLIRVGETGPNGYKLVLVHARAVLVEKAGVQYAIEIPMFQDGE